MSINLTLLATATLFLSLLAQVTIRLNVLETRYSIEKVRQVALEKDMKLRELKASYARLASPERVALNAENRLAMSINNSLETRRF